MAGDWQTLSETPIYDRDFKKEEEEDVKPDKHSIGVRKRRFEGEEEEDASEPVVRKAWGSTFRTYSEAGPSGDSDLESLLERSKTIGNRRGEMGHITDTRPGTNSDARAGLENGKGVPAHDTPVIKREESNEGTTSVPVPAEMNAVTVGIKEEDDTPGSAVVFKKRKMKPIRQR